MGMNTNFNLNDMQALAACYRLKELWYTPSASLENFRNGDYVHYYGQSGGLYESEYRDILLGQFDGAVVILCEILRTGHFQSIDEDGEDCLVPATDETYILVCYGEGYTPIARQLAKDKPLRRWWGCVYKTQNNRWQVRHYMPKGQDRFSPELDTWDEALQWEESNFGGKITF